MLHVCAVLCVVVFLFVIVRGGGDSGCVGAVVLFFVNYVNTMMVVMGMVLINVVVVVKVVVFVLVMMVEVVMLVVMNVVWR